MLTRLPAVPALQKCGPFGNEALSNEMGPISEWILLAPEQRSTDAAARRADWRISLNLVQRGSDQL